MPQRFNHQHVARHLLTAIILTAVAAMALPSVFAETSTTQPPIPVPQTQPSAASPEAPKLIIGTYQPRKAFASYHLRGQFIKRIKPLRDEMEQAQQNHNQQKMRAIEEQVRQVQDRVIKQFAADIRSIMPEVAKEAKVPLVAVAVAYKDPDIETKDVTSLVIEKLNAEHPQTQPTTKAQTQPSD